MVEDSNVPAGDREVELDVHTEGVGDADCAARVASPSVVGRVGGDPHVGVKGGVGISGGSDSVGDDVAGVHRQHVARGQPGHHQWPVCHL